MLIGEYTHNLDEKKRLMMPAKVRKSLGREIVITKGLDSCLFVYPLMEWQKLAEKISRQPIAKGDVRSFARSILGGAFESEIDSLGRILIPDYLKEYAHLGKEIVVVGVYDRLEIWDKELWEEYRKHSESSINDLAEKLGELGI